MKALRLALDSAECILYIGTQSSETAAIQEAAQMKIVIKKDQCAGHARCNAVAGDLFPLDETGYIATSGFEVPPGQEARARRASRACPERVIEVVEDDTVGAATGKPSMRTQP
jgi:ferredoxin